VCQAIFQAKNMRFSIEIRLKPSFRGYIISSIPKTGFLQGMRVKMSKLDNRTSTRNGYLTE
jgi:hypothetical protein